MSRRPAASWLLLGCAAVYAWLRPPLYNRDGFVYGLQARSPLDYLNPHHLLWLPLQSLLLNASSAFAFSSSGVFQGVGVLANLLTLYGFYRLLQSRTRAARMAGLWTLVLAFSPQFWFLGFQNQPYPLVMLCLVVFFWSWQKADKEEKKQRFFILAGLALAVATLLQQAAVLLVAGAAMARGLRARPFRPDRF